MKKLLALLLAFAMCFALVACGGNTEEESTTTTTEDIFAGMEEETDAAEETTVADETAADEEHVTFEIFVCPNKALIMEFCKYGSRLEVLSPAPVREAVAAELRKAADIYTSAT